MSGKVGGGSGPLSGGRTLEYPEIVGMPTRKMKFDEPLTVTSAESAQTGKIIVSRESTAIHAGRRKI